jgi:hypothetical protein
MLIFFAAEFSQRHRTILSSYAFPVALAYRQPVGADPGTIYFTTLDNKVRKVCCTAQACYLTIMFSVVLLEICNGMSAARVLGRQT